MYEFLHNVWMCVAIVICNLLVNPQIISWEQAQTGNIYSLHWLIWRHVFFLSSSSSPVHQRHPTAAFSWWNAQVEEVVGVKPGRCFTWLERIHSRLVFPSNRARPRWAAVAVGGAQRWIKEVNVCLSHAGGGVMPHDWGSGCQRNHAAGVNLVTAHATVVHMAAPWLL